MFQESIYPPDSLIRRLALNTDTSPVLPTVELLKSYLSETNEYGARSKKSKPPGLRNPRRTLVQSLNAYTGATVTPFAGVNLAPAPRSSSSSVFVIRKSATDGEGSGRRWSKEGRSGSNQSLGRSRSKLTRSRSLVGRSKNKIVPAPTSKDSCSSNQLNIAPERLINFM